MSGTPADWTLGQPGLAYEACIACGRNWYFQRGFCPRCGSTSVEMRASGCQGTVHAITTVARAPSPEWQARAPYGIALIDLDEGVRVMTHAEPDMAIGDAVNIIFSPMGSGFFPVAQQRS
ncbi:MAG: OB-fold domain-containing protein [Rhodopila sp.]|nr:OB-fold domain-containing protein [Rhodopila sp.]